MQSHRLGAIVEARVRFGPERAREHARVARSAFPGVILGETGQAVASQPVGARVADVQQVGGAGAQHERGEGAGHPFELGILAAERVDPCVERTDDPGPGAADLHGLRQIPESVEKTAHREFRGDAAALGAADPVGDRRHHLPARLGQLSANDRGGEVLIPLARPFFGAKSDTRSHAGVALRHRMQLPSTFLAAGAAPPPDR